MLLFPMYSSFWDRHCRYDFLQRWFWRPGLRPGLSRLGFPHQFLHVGALARSESRFSTANNLELQQGKQGGDFKAYAGDPQKHLCRGLPKGNFQSMIHTPSYAKTDSATAHCPEVGASSSCNRYAYQVVASETDKKSFTRFRP